MRLKQIIKKYDPTDTILSHAFKRANEIFEKYPELTNIELLWQHLRYRNTVQTGNTSHWAVTPRPVDVSKKDLQSLVDLLPVNHIAALLNLHQTKYPPCLKGVEIYFSREGDFRLTRWVKR